MFHSSRATCTGVGAPLGHNRGVAMVPQSLAREQQNSALFARHRAATIVGSATLRVTATPLSRRYVGNRTTCNVTAKHRARPCIEILVSLCPEPDSDPRCSVLTHVADTITGAQRRRSRAPRVVTDSQVSNAHRRKAVASRADLAICVAGLTSCVYATRSRLRPKQRRWAALSCGRARTETPRSGKHVHVGHAYQERIARVATGPRIEPFSHGSGT
jgi:hypothetical protein